MAENEPTVTYRLPDGRQVEVHYSASLNRYRIPYSLEDGRTVYAEKVSTLLLPCSCGQPVHLRVMPLRVNRKTGVHHWLEHEDGTDACPGPRGRWSTAVLKPYPKEETERPGAALMIRWNDWRLLTSTIHKEEEKMAVLDVVKALAEGEDLYYWLLDQREVWRGPRSSFRWWDEVFIVVEIGPEDGRRLIGYVGAETTGDDTPEEKGWHFRQETVCDVEAYEHTETRYRPRSTKQEGGAA